MDPLSSILFSRQSSFSHENEFYIEGQIESLDAGSKTLLRSVVSQTHCLKITQNVAFEFLSFNNFYQFCIYLVTLFDHKLQNFKMTIFGIFDELLSTLNVNVARFARNVK